MASHSNNIDDNDNEQPRRRSSGIPLQRINTDLSAEDRGLSTRPSLQRINSATATPSAAYLGPSASTYWDQPYESRYHDVPDNESPLDPGALAVALPPGLDGFGPDGFYGAGSPYIEETPASDNDYSSSDREPLTASAVPIAGSLARPPEEQHRDSFQTVSDVDNHPRDNHGHQRDPAPGLRPHTQGFGNMLAPTELRLSRASSGGGALQRAGSIVRAMSQRVVNLSGESEVVETRSSRQRSRSPGSRAGSRHQSLAPSRTHSREPSRSRSPHNSMGVDTSYHSQTIGLTPEKFDSHLQPGLESVLPTMPMPNPLRGKSLGIFPPDSTIRNRLCDLLVNPYTEPIILFLIVLQTVLLAVEASGDVFEEGGRPERWGQTVYDWAILALFIIFTLELCIRIIVSGFILNAEEYSTIDRQKGVRAAVIDQYRAIFQPQELKSSKAHTSFKPTPSAFARSMTTIMQGPQRLPATLEEQQRFQLARRAFLRHGFNRLDFVAVVSFWISFVMGVAGLEFQYKIYIFKMMSCLRIMRLLSITNGTAIILRSLKKATPLLIRVAFFISFFWLLFAIVGVQSFKESLSRTCVFPNPLNPDNLTLAYRNGNAFCGGYIDNSTGNKLPWMRVIGDGPLRDSLEEGTSTAKGFICPRGSICLQGENPSDGTVNFDNIFNSLELVFVLISANTFTDIMYWTMGSDYMLAALYFGVGIMVLLLWLVNLLIAVITSSFQVIREETKTSAFTADEEPLGEEDIETQFQKVSTLQKIYRKTFYVWIVVIAFGLLVQALRSSDMGSDRRRFIDVTEVVVTIILVLEMILRISAHWRNFHKSWRNIFDLGLAIITTIILLPPIRHTRAYWWLSIFQILRVYRVVLAIPVTAKLIMLVLGNSSGIANLMLFVFLTTFLVSILAAQLFRGVIPKEDDGEFNNVSFYSILNCFVGMYNVLTTENWTDILYDVTSYTSELGTAWIGATFLIGWFILAFFILLNMFIAVIQENFDLSEDEKRFEQVKAFLQRRDLGGSSTSTPSLSTIFSFGRSRQRKDPLDYGPALTEMLLKDSVVKDFLEESYNRGMTNAEPDPALRGPQRAVTTGLLTNDIKPGYLSTLWGNFKRKITKREPNPFYANLQFDDNNETFDARKMAQQAVSASTTRKRAQREYLVKHPRYNTSLYLFSPRNKLRRLCQTIVGPARGLERYDGVEPNKIAWYSFSAFIYAAIVAMVILACITTPLYQREYQEEHPFSITNWYVWTDMAFAVLFTAEGAIKVIADGLLFTPNAFLRSSWGLLDAVVLITLWINVVTLFVNDGAISRAVGAFKALRALRLLNVSDSARDTFHSLIIVGWWKITAAAFVSISLLIPFAIYGLNLFNGLLVTCNDGDGIQSLSSCYGEYSHTPFSDEWPIIAPRVADNPYFNFDDFGASLFTLFQIVSQEGWSDVVFAASAITRRGEQPEDLASEGNAFFFIVFNLLATVFVLTLFISVFMRNYTEQTGVAFLTADQRSWLEVRKLLRQISPSKSSYNDKGKKWKKWCHKRAIEKRGKWYLAITVVLCIHLLLLVVEFTTEPDWWRITRTFIFLGFIIMYMVNMCIRIVGLGWTRYRRSSWDLYALVVVNGAFFATIALFVAFLLTADNSSPDDTYVQVHKFFLVAIVLLLIPRNDALDQLFKTAAASLTVIGNLLATWLVLFLVFAIAFTQAFSLTRFAENEDHNVNFRTVPKALILLFRMSFGEGWNGIMEDYAFIIPPLCVADDDFFRSDCGSKSWARFLFVAWNIISMYIFVNLFVSLIYESFSYVYQRSSGMGAVDRDEIRRFKEAWRTVDPDGSGWISKEKFHDLLGELSGVFSMRIYEPEDSVHAILEEVRGVDARGSRHMSIGGPASTEIDLAALNQRLARLDTNKIRERRRKFNVFYGEIMAGADVDYGIGFTNVLMTLAQYNIITDSKSLKLDEFLKRRARLQRVDEDIRRKTVQHFFEMLYQSGKFQAHIRKKQAGRMTGIPEIMVPDIYVDDDNIDGLTDDGKARSSGVRTPVTHLSVDMAQGSPNSKKGGSPSSRGSRGSGGSRGSSPTREDPSQRMSAWYGGTHPLSTPRTRNGSTSGASPGHEATTSAFSFEFFDPDGPASGSYGGNAAQSEMRRRGSGANPSSPTGGMMDDNVWVESIRKSRTVRKSGKGGSHRFTDIG